MLEEDDDDYTLFFDAQQAWEIFMDLSCPWKISMDGVAGVDDGIIIEVINLHPIKKASQLSLFREVQAAARGALRAISEQRERDRQNEKRR